MFVLNFPVLARCVFSAAKQVVYGCDAGVCAAHRIHTHTRGDDSEFLQSLTNRNRSDSSRSESDRNEAEKAMRERVSFHLTSTSVREEHKNK